MDYKFKTTPYQHQLDALEKCSKKRDYALFCEMGTGKSKILLDNIGMLYDEGRINERFNGLHLVLELNKIKNY